jgi:hypothetical protein
MCNTRASDHAGRGRAVLVIWPSIDLEQSIDGRGCLSFCGCGIAKLNENDYQLDLETREFGHHA